MFILCFYLKSFPLRFKIVQSIIEKKVLEAIKLFLLELSGNFKTKRINSNPIQIIEEQKSKLYENRKLMLNLNINDRYHYHYHGYYHDNCSGTGSGSGSGHSFLSHIIVPFFNKLNFLTKKKELDYKDWKNILELKTHGWHLSEEGANLIVAISSHMNNNRLSSNVSSSTKLISPADCELRTVELNTEKNKKKTKTKTNKN